MIVAIDGPAGSGKSTVAHAIAKKCGFTYLDTGAMYRCVTLACLRRGVDVADEGAVTDVARSISIEFLPREGGQTVLLDGEDVTADIRTPEVDRAVSPVAAIAEVRSAMVELQREVAKKGDIVAEGRDIGTVVFPAAEVKVFLTADASARAHRRAVQRQGGDAATGNVVATDKASEEAILADIKRRDAYDSTRKEAPLRAAEDAHHIDSSNLGVDEVVAKVMELIDNAR